MTDLSSELRAEVMAIAGQDFREASLDEIDRQEELYKKRLKGAERCRMLGKVAALAPLIAAGVLMSTSHTEKEYASARLLSDIASLSVGALGGLIGLAQSDERKIKASEIASRAAVTALEAGIDPPAWAHHGMRLRTTIYPNDAR